MLKTKIAKLLFLLLLLLPAFSFANPLPPLKATKFGLNKKHAPIFDDQLQARVQELVTKESKKEWLEWLLMILIPAVPALTVAFYQDRNARKRADEQHTKTIELQKQKEEAEVKKQREAIIKALLLVKNNLIFKLKPKLNGLKELSNMAELVEKENLLYSPISLQGSYSSTKDMCLFLSIEEMEIIAEINEALGIINFFAKEFDKIRVRIDSLADELDEIGIKVLVKMQVFINENKNFARHNNIRAEFQRIISAWRSGKKMLGHIEYAEMKKINEDLKKNYSLKLAFDDDFLNHVRIYDLIIRSSNHLRSKGTSYIINVVDRLVAKLDNLINQITNSPKTK